MKDPQTANNPSLESADMSSSNVECRLCCVWNLKRLLKWFGQQIPSTTPESHVAQQSKPRNATPPGLLSIRRSDTKIARVRLVALIASGASRDSDVLHAFCSQPLPSQARRSSTLKATSSFHERKLKLDPQIESFEGLLCLRRALDHVHNALTNCAGTKQTP